MRALRLALDSRRVLCVTCACTATAPLAINPASNNPATHFTLDLKPNINDYSCTSLALLLWNVRPACWNTMRVSLIRTSAAPQRPLPQGVSPHDGEKKQQRRLRQTLSRLCSRHHYRCRWTLC